MTQAIAPRLGTSVRRTRRVPNPPLGRFAGTNRTSLICLAWLHNVAEQEHGVHASGAWCHDESVDFFGS
jgi:hypothetical protein